MVSLAEDRPRLDKYEVLEEIGHGGMATVYRAHDKRLGRDVAVKVIHRHLRESKEVAARFVSEARAVAKLRHRNIVEVYDVSDEGETERYLIVELVPGITLRKLLSDNGHMPAEIAAAVGIELAGALEHAHQQGVVHRDVKPENVLVDFSEPPPESRDSETEELDRGRIKITDFGIAKLLDAQGVTSTGQVLGSPAHMAPEQIEGGDVTARSDVFGLGVLLYECMVGRLPFDGKNPAQVLRKVLDGTFTPPERARPSVGQGLSNVVVKALAREPEGRYASCVELADALRAELETVTFGNPRRELSQYLRDHKAYVELYEPRMVENLVELGKKARSERLAPLAAAYFNRALAFRPEDGDLLRQVAGLAEAERRKRLGIQGAIGLLVASVVGAGAYVATRPPGPTLGIAPDNGVTPRPIVSGNDFVPSDPLPKNTSAPSDKSKNPKVPIVAPDGTGVAAPSGKRKVKINVVGARGGARVKVDDTEIPNWIMSEIELAVGSHKFEFIPRNNSCCENLGVVYQTINLGEGTQEVTGKIPFKAGELSFSGPEGSSVRCPLLFAGQLSPGSKKIPMNTLPTATDTCTLTGPDGTAVKSRNVTIQAGGTYSLAWE